MPLGLECTTTGTRGHLGDCRLYAACGASEHHLLYLLQDRAFSCCSSDCATSCLRNTNPPTPNRPAAMKEQAAVIKNSRLFKWRLVGPGSNLVLCWIEWSIPPKSLTEQAPQITLSVAISPIVVQTADICWCNMPWVGIQYP
jgi:hypothetical protein